jgi:hypothetical protein
VVLSLLFSPDDERPAEEPIMPWYSAHAIMAVRFKKGRRRRIPIWENIILVRAKDADEAWEKASVRAKEDEGDDEGTMIWNGKPASHVFIGLRVLVSVSHRGTSGRLRSGDELTYLEYDVADERSLRALVGGKTCDVRYAAWRSADIA